MQAQTITGSYMPIDRLLKNETTAAATSPPPLCVAPSRSRVAPHSTSWLRPSPALSHTVPRVPDSVSQSMLQQGRAVTVRSANAGWHCHHTEPRHLITMPSTAARYRQTTSPSHRFRSCPHLRGSGAAGSTPHPPDCRWRQGHAGCCVRTCGPHQAVLQCKRASSAPRRTTPSSPRRCLT